MATTENWLEVGKLTWFYREALPPHPELHPTRLPVVLLHGLVSQSYSWRDVLPTLADQGFRAIAPDWIGCGFSAMPDKRDFGYAPEQFVQALGDFVDKLQLEQFHLVSQGFLGSAGIQYALRHPERVARLAIFNAPLTATAKLPRKVAQMSLPLAGEMMVQDPLLVDRTLEGGGGYQVKLEDLDVYRRPWLRTSDAGFSLLHMIRNLKLKEATAEIAEGLPTWPHPLLLGWGLRDPWLPAEQAKTLAKTISTADFVGLEEVGHYPQEDWHEKVSEALLRFLLRKD